MQPTMGDGINFVVSGNDGGGSPMSNAAGTFDSRADDVQGQTVPFEGKKWWVVASHGR